MGGPLWRPWRPGGPQSVSVVCGRSQTRAEKASGILINVLFDEHFLKKVVLAGPDSHDSFKTRDVD